MFQLNRINKKIVKKVFIKNKILSLFILIIVIIFQSNFTLGEAKNDFKNQTIKNAKVIKVSDGDTIHVLVKNQKIKIRLAGIDAPETKQNYGKESTRFLKRLIDNRYVLIKTSGIDKYKRVLGTIYNSSGLNINEELVKKGMAWSYKRSGKYFKLEQEAKRKKIGLWSKSNPIEPRKYRKRYN